MYVWLFSVITAVVQGHIPLACDHAAVLPSDMEGMALPVAEAEFRNYIHNPRQALVENHYRMMRSNQTVEFYRRMEIKWTSFDHAKMTIREAAEALMEGGYVDSADPDTGLPNIVHGFQTAEGARAAGEPDWMQLTGLIHDLGKLMYLWGTGEDGQDGAATGDQWALGGDTWVLGCEIPAGLVFPEFNSLNPDMQDPRYNTKYGIYQPNTGLHNLLLAFGHDEYLYRVLKANPSVSLPKEALDMVRFHSFYPWHSRGAYTHLLAPEDDAVLASIRHFNSFDLYTKGDAEPDIASLWAYYQPIIDKYTPGKLNW